MGKREKGGGVSAAIQAAGDGVGGGGGGSRGDGGVEGSFVRRPMRVNRRVLFIQMEYCKRTLADVIEKEGPLPEEHIWRYVRQLLGGLQHVHSHGLTHRDVKPKNIFVSVGKDYC